MYGKLFIMLILSFIAMYTIMYVSVSTYNDAYGNLNQIYMTSAMISLMLLIELSVMNEMYLDQNLNFELILVSIIVLLGSIFSIRKQKCIDDKQFLLTMIPHHSMALLQVDGILKTTKNKNIRYLAKKIKLSQKCEIDYMKKLLDDQNTRYDC